MFLIVSSEAQILLGDANANLNINLPLPETLSVIKIIHGEVNKDIKMQMKRASLFLGTGVLAWSLPGSLPFPATTCPPLEFPVKKKSLGYGRGRVSCLRDDI